jgi:hypothetical protein
MFIKDAMEKVQEIVSQNSEAIEKKVEEVMEQKAEEIDKKVDEAEVKLEAVAEKAADEIEKKVDEILDVAPPEVKKVLDIVGSNLVEVVDGRDFSCFCFGFLVSLRITRKDKKSSPSKSEETLNIELPPLPQGSLQAEPLPPKDTQPSQTASDQK